MKKFFIILFGVLCLGMSQAQAQYNPASLTFSKGQFFDQNGTVLNVDQISQIIGSDIFNETYLGAMKQYKAGKNLVTAGAVGLGVGVAAAVGCVVSGDWYSKMYDDEEDYTPTNSEKTLMAGFVGGVIVAILGGTALDVGIPLLSIGKSRLSWIADNYNETRGAQNTVALRVTGCSAGPGIGVSIVF
ncbi:MAG: hypothetical protein IJM41_05960 [Bacteroidales bacterium]|nr:hypothetical protein [Bacteroidales bacterium]